jgi:hypothetical protein
MILLTPDLRERLLANGRERDVDHIPVVRFFNPIGAGTWLATELDADGDTLFGLADLGEPELGSFSLSEMQALRLPFGMGIERDILFEGAFPISVYAAAARRTGSIVDAERTLHAAARSRGGGFVMRFRSWPKPAPYRDTSRKRSAFLRKQRLAREALPLFADEIAARQHGVDEEMARRAVWWDQLEHDRRRERAARWREARSRLFALPDDLRRTVRALWRTCPYPADPASFADFLHQIAVGRLDPHRPPWIFHQKTSARITADPATFGEAFRQIGRRKIDGEPGTAPTDELLFCGNLGSGILFLASRVRLLDPAVDVYTASNHGPRDSHNGGASHRIDIEVRGNCSDVELALIARLAQAAHTRPVVVRRIMPARSEMGVGGAS